MNIKKKPVPSYLYEQQVFFLSRSHNIMLINLNVFCCKEVVLKHFYI